MNAPAPDIGSFYTRMVPDDFNRSLDAQAALGEAGRRVFEGMCALDATIRVDVTAAGGHNVVATHYLNIAQGRMSAADTPAHPPFLRIQQSPAAVARFAREAGGSLTALLGALAGLGADMKLTRKRMLDLEAIDGLVEFHVTGDDGFSLRVHFGTGELPETPVAVLRMTEAAYAELRAGRIDPQTAFLDDTIETEGELQKLMQLAFAIVAPD